MSFFFQRFDAPEGLISLLRCFVLKPGKTPDEGWARLYRKLWSLLWVSCQFHHLCAVWSVFENNTSCLSSSFMGERFCCKWIGKAMNNYRLFAWFWHVPIFLLRKAVFSILMLFYSVLWNSHLSNLLLNWTPRVISEYFSAIIFPGCSYDLIDVNNH